MPLLRFGSSLVNTDRLLLVKTIGQDKDLSTVLIFDTGQESSIPASDAKGLVEAFTDKAEQEST